MKKITISSVEKEQLEKLFSLEPGSVHTQALAARCLGRWLTIVFVDSHWGHTLHEPTNTLLVTTDGDWFEHYSVGLQRWVLSLLPFYDDERIPLRKMMSFTTLMLRFFGESRQILADHKGLSFPSESYQYSSPRWIPGKVATDRPQSTLPDNDRQLEY